MLNNCRAVVLPFEDKKIISVGRHCPDSSGYRKQFRIYDNAGKELARSLDFIRDIFSQYRLPKGYAFFSGTARRQASDEEILITYFNRKLKKEKTERIDTDPLGVPNYGLHLNYKDPQLTDDGNWIIPIHWGEPDRIGVELLGMKIFKTNGKDILWQFPMPGDWRSVEQFQIKGEKVIVSLRKGNIVILDKNGKVESEFELNVKGRFEHMLIVNNEVVVISKTWKKVTDGNQFETFLTRFDLTGKRIEERSLYKGDDFRVLQMLPFGKKSLLLTGPIVSDLRRGDSQAFVWKIDLEKNTKEESTSVIDMENEIDLLEKELEDDFESKKEETISQKPIISNALFDYVDEVALAVNIFPNPASIVVNFVLSEDANPNTSYEVLIFSTAGKLVKKTSFSGTRFELNVADFLTGTYLYSVIPKGTKKQKIMSGRFVKI